MVELLVSQHVHLGLVIEGVGPLQQGVPAADYLYCDCAAMYCTVPAADPLQCLQPCSVEHHLARHLRAAACRRNQNQQNQCHNLAPIYRGHPVSHSI